MAIIPLPLTLDSENGDYWVCKGVRSTRLTEATFAIAKVLFASPRHTFSREEIMRLANMDPELDDQNVDARIKYLRRMIDKITNGKGNAFIRGVYGAGYYYEPHPRNYKFHPKKRRVFIVRDQGLPHLSDSCVRLGHFILDIGRHRLYFGNVFTPIFPQGIKVLEPFFRRAHGWKFTQSALAALSPKINDRPIAAAEAMRRARAPFSRLVPRQVFSNIFVMHYGDSRSFNKNYVRGLNPADFDPPSGSLPLTQSRGPVRSRKVRNVSETSSRRGVKNG